MDLPSSSVGKESTCQCRRPRFDPWVRKISWKRKWQPTPVFLPGKSHGLRSLLGYSPRGRKSQRWLNHHQHCHEVTKGWTQLSNWAHSHTCTCVRTHTHTHTHMLSYYCQSVAHPFYHQLPIHMFYNGYIVFQLYKLLNNSLGNQNLCSSQNTLKKNLKD